MLAIPVPISQTRKGVGRESWCRLIEDFGKPFLFKEVGNEWSPGRDLGLRDLGLSLMSIALNFLNYAHRGGPIFLSFVGIVLSICLT